MNIYFVRHGYAEQAFPDEERNLSRHGILKLQNSFEIWKEYIDQIDQIITSPLNRAYQTASMIQNYFNVDNEMVVDKSLSPGSRLEDVEILVDSLGFENIIIVGHLPDVSIMISELVSSSGMNINFTPGSIAGVTIANSFRKAGGRLNFLIEG